jgi:hypothetical protein
MKKKLLLIIFCFISFLTASSAQGYKELEFISMHQLINYDQRFDLSGIVNIDGRNYVIADKENDSIIYEIEFKGKDWFISNTIPFSIGTKLDLEGIDYCNNYFYIINEENAGLYQISPGGNSKEINIKYAEANEDPSKWKGNAGLEGIAIDCNNNRVYLVKERQDRYIMEVDLNTGDILTKFTLPETDSNDFSDAKFENGYLYLLERHGNYVAKVDAKTKKLVEKVSYTETCSAPEGKIYEPSKYGLAEALLMTKDEIWIGLDNNHIEVSDYARKKYGISGQAPVLIKFKRPVGF